LFPTNSLPARVANRQISVSWCKTIEKGAKDMEIQTKRVSPDIVVLEITGRITLGRECKHLEWTTEGLLRDNEKKIIVDLSHVTQLDSTGIGIIMMCAGQLKQAGGELRVAGATGHVENVLKMTNVGQVVGLHPTAAAAAIGF
jgi:anti-sigma B factor antagonist